MNAFGLLSCKEQAHVFVTKGTTHREARGVGV